MNLTHQKEVQVPIFHHDRVIELFKSGGATPKQWAALAECVLIASMDDDDRARSKVLQKALTYLDGLAKDAAGDMSLQMDLAQAYIKVGELQSSQGIVRRALGDREGTRRVARPDRGASSLW